MSRVTRRSAIRLFSLAPAAILLDQASSWRPLIERESSSMSADRPVVDCILDTTGRERDAHYWRFSPGAHLLMEAMADEAWPQWRIEIPQWRAREKAAGRKAPECWPEWIERARREDICFSYQGIPGSLTTRRLLKLAAKSGTQVRLYFTKAN